MQLTHLTLQVRTQQSNKMELYFRPGDPYSHPAFGELRPCNNFLLKISKKKCRNPQTTEYSSGVSEHSADRINFEPNISSDNLIEALQQINEPECESSAASAELEVRLPGQVRLELSADIVARVSEAYNFNGQMGLCYIIWWRFSTTFPIIPAAQLYFVPTRVLFPKGMVDYQHVLAVHADVARRRKRKWAEVEPQFG